MKRKVLLIPLIIFLAIAAALLWQLARNAEGDDPTNLESALIGKPVPKFRLESLDNPGQFYQADVLTQGKPVLLNVWATWCPTCRAEHQYLNQLSAQGIRVVGMNYKDDRQKAISWLKELGNPYALSQKRSLLTATASFAIAMRAISILASGKKRSSHCGRNTVRRPHNEVFIGRADADDLRLSAGDHRRVAV